MTLMRLITIKYFNRLTALIYIYMSVPPTNGLAHTALIGPIISVFKGCLIWCLGAEGGAGLMGGQYKRENKASLFLSWDNCPRFWPHSLNLVGRIPDTWGDHAGPSQHVFAIGNGESSRNSILSDGSNSDGGSEFSPVANIKTSSTDTAASPPAKKKCSAPWQCVFSTSYEKYEWFTNLHSQGVSPPSSSKCYFI